MNCFRGYVSVEAGVFCEGTNLQSLPDSWYQGCLLYSTSQSPFRVSMLIVSRTPNGFIEEWTCIARKESKSSLLSIPRTPNAVWPIGACGVLVTMLCSELARFICSTFQPHAQQQIVRSVVSFPSSELRSRGSAAE